MKKVLLIRLSAMGDTTQALGAVRALAQARPDLELHFLSQEENLPLLQNLPYLQSCIPHRRGDGWRGMWQSRRRLRALAADVALDLQGNWKSALLARLSGAGRRLGAVGSKCQEPMSRILLSEKVDFAEPGHPATVALQLVRQLAPEAEDLPPQLLASDAEVEAAAKAVAAAGLNPNKPFTLFVVTPSSDPRHWWPAAMQRQAQLEEQPVLWLLGPELLGAGVEDAGLPAGAAILRQQAGELRQLVGLGVLLQRCGGRVLGPDRGPTHVLNASGAETLLLSGPQDPLLTAARGAQVWQRQDAPACMPCRQRKCAHPQGPICMDFDLSAASRL